MRKILAMLLALVMLTVPVLSMAETATKVDFTITDANIDLIPGVPEELSSMINEVLRGFAVHSYDQSYTEDDEQTGLVIDLSNQPALNFNLQIVNSTLYAGSNLLGDTTVAITADQVNALVDVLWPQLQEQVPQLAAMDVETAKAAVTTAFAHPGAKVEVAAPAVPEIDPALIAELTANAQVDENGAIIITITPDMMQKLVGAVLNNEQLTAQVAAVYQDDFVVSVSVDENGALSAMNMSTTLTAGEQKVDMFVNLTTSALENDGVEIQASVAMNPQGSDEIVLVFFMMDMTGEDATYYMAMSDAADGENFVDMLEANGWVATTHDGTATTTQCVTDVKIIPEEGSEPVEFAIDVEDVKDGDAESVSFGVRPINSDKTYITVCVTTQPIDMQPELNKDNAVEVLTLDQEGMEAFIQQVSESALTAVFGAAQLLPEAVFELILGAAMGN